jgi:hypothetical protein
MPNIRVALALVVLVLAAAGCGGETASGGDEPASAVPRDAAMYFEATLRPEGSQREDALAAAGKVLQTSDPEGRIRELVDEAFASSDDPKLDYARDVEPWLGEKVGFWLSATGDAEQEATGVALLAATDEDKARETMDRVIAASDERFSEGEHEGVAIKVDQDGVGVAVGEGYVMVGTEAEIKRSIDAVNGDSLEGTDRYEDAVGELEDERLGHFFVDAKALVDQAAKADPEAAEQIQQFRRIFPIDELGPITGAFSADGDRLALDVVTGAAGGDLFKRFGLLTGTGSTPLVGELPDGSWLAAGSPKVGETVKALYDQLAGALGGAAIEQQLRQELGLDLQQDVFSWIGDVAFFVRGETADAADGGVVISVTDQERAAAAFGKLVGLLRTQGGVDARPTRVDGAENAFEIRQAGSFSPLSGGGGAESKPVVIARSDDRVAIAYGADAASDALSPDAKLADGEAYGRAQDLLGDDFDLSFLLSMDPIVSLVESSGQADAEFEQARPYIEAFSVIASGTKVDDERARSRFVAGLK